MFLLRVGMNKKRTGLCLEGTNAGCVVQKNSRGVYEQAMLFFLRANLLLD